MADLEKLRANLEARGFRTAYFPTADEAAAYLDGPDRWENGGHRRVHDGEGDGALPQAGCPQPGGLALGGGALRDAVLTDVYITSANALAETGEIVNIDGTATGLHHPVRPPEGLLPGGCQQGRPRL